MSWYLNVRLDPEARPLLVGLGGALSVASTVGFALRRRFRDTPVIANLNARIRAWWVMIALATAVLLAGPTAIVLLFAAVSFLALREFASLCAGRTADHDVWLASFFIALPGQYYLAATAWYGLFSVFIPVYGFLILPILAALRADSKNFLVRAAETQWGLMICVYCLSHVPALLMLRIPGFSDRDPRRDVLLVVFLIAVVQSCDVLQYLWGKFLGRHKIAPELSPSKTVEGLVGGMASAVVLGVLLAPITPFGKSQAAAMSIAITLMGFLGGLVMSAIKRDLGVKDWGQTIPGHGGILDRMDSICFAAPVFFHLTRYFFTP
jgi:phosphatidate cytidylyltransferase